ncbi:membrane protein, partial [Mycobacterium numidiamassiliense]
VKTSSLYGPVFFTVMAVLFLALFVLNACTHGTMLGLISTGGLTALMGYIAYRTWSRKRRINRH